MSDGPEYKRAPSTNIGAATVHKPHEGKFGIVTGGSRGIGLAIAQNLAAKGCNLLLVYTSESSKKPTEDLCEQLQSQHRIQCVPVQADLSDPTRAAPHIVTTAKNNFTHPKTGKFQVDILINNAGIAGDKTLNDPDRGKIDITQFNKQYYVNVLAPLLLTQEVAPYLPTDRSGRVVNISSVSSSIGCEGQSIYAGTKGAIEAMTRVWSRELAERATVNAVNPGPVHGDMYMKTGKKFWESNQKHVDSAPLMKYNGEEEIKSHLGEEFDEYDRMVREGMGGQRPGFTHEIAGVVGMLCSTESAWTTGSVICANGGMKMSIA